MAKKSKKKTKSKPKTTKKSNPPLASQAFYYPISKAKHEETYAESNSRLLEKAKDLVADVRYSCIDLYWDVVCNKGLVALTGAVGFVLGAIVDHFLIK